MYKQFIKNYDKNDLVKFCENNKIEKYRSHQIFQELYYHKRKKFNEFKSLPIELRNLLNEKFDLYSLKIKKLRKSKDSSIKFLFELIDGKLVESVYMPWYSDDFNEIERVTLCVSTMAGCPVECAFCATGTLGFQRNLNVAEIIDQVIIVEQELGSKISNIVFMGMGEPLLNYNNVKKAISIFTNSDSNFFSRKKITLSTVGITEKIKQLADEDNPPKLALSLHATTNGFRQKIIPLSKKTTLKSIMDAIEYYYRKTGIPITYEYIPFDGLNDTDNDAKRLARILKRVPSKVNLIPFNDISFALPNIVGQNLKATPKEKILEFGNKIREYGGKVTIRDTFGTDIEAACGQLALYDKS